MGEILAKSWQSISARYGAPLMVILKIRNHPIVVHRKDWGSVPSMFAEGTLSGTQKDSAVLMRGCYVYMANSNTNDNVFKLKSNSFESSAISAPH